MANTSTDRHTLARNSLRVRSSVFLGLEVVMGGLGRGPQLGYGYGPRLGLVSVSVSELGLGLGLGLKSVGTRYVYNHDDCEYEWRRAVGRKFFIFKNFSKLLKIKN